LIRKRIPRQDDKVILELVRQLLVPYAQITQPNIRVDMAMIRKRLKPCMTFVDTSGRRIPGGFISLRLEKNAMYIDMLAVDPRWQGKGIGTRLLEHAERTAVLTGYSEVLVWVDDTNTHAQQFYASRRYEVVHYDANIRCYMLSKQVQSQIKGQYR
jgi:ribosomal protein S18 acetylase RimI-like enzyme